MLTTDGKLNEFGHQQWSQPLKKCLLIELVSTRKCIPKRTYSNLLEHVRLLIVIIQQPLI